jgi:hypothetical protein
MLLQWSEHVLPVGMWSYLQNGGGFSCTMTAFMSIFMFLFTVNMAWAVTEIMCEMNHDI